MKSKKPLVSIIIPLHVITNRFFSDLAYYDKLKNISYELLIVTDTPLPYRVIPKGKILLTHKTNSGPAEKRDLAMQYARGVYCAFIDDDAYPHPLWLSEAVKEFTNDSNVVAVGGPGITPAEEGRWERLGGLVYESILTSGKAQHRFVDKGMKRQLTTDWPAYNLIVRTDVLRKVGGYDCTFYGGEDTFLCLKLIKYGKIVYTPKAVVFHHRRALFVPHMRQIYNVGVHRGYFFRVFPETSRKLFYVIPSILTFGLGSSLLVFILVPTFRLGITLIMAIVFIIAMFSTYRKTHVWDAVIISIGIIVTHLAYGIGFLRGITRNELLR